MNARDDLRTPLKRARGLGSAKSGTGHFIWQRVTAMRSADTRTASKPGGPRVPGLTGGSPTRTIA